MPSWGLSKYIETELQTICFYLLESFLKKQKKISNYNQGQKLWEKLQFRVSTPFSLWTMLRNNEQNLRQAMLWVRNIV